MDDNQTYVFISSLSPDQQLDRQKVAGQSTHQRLIGSTQSQQQLILWISLYGLNRKGDRPDYSLVEVILGGHLTTDNSSSSSDEQCKCVPLDKHPFYKDKN